MGVWEPQFYWYNFLGGVTLCIYCYETMPRNESRKASKKEGLVTRFNLCTNYLASFNFCCSNKKIRWISFILLRCRMGMWGLCFLVMMLNLATTPVQTPSRQGMGTHQTLIGLNFLPSWLVWDHMIACTYGWENKFPQLPPILVAGIHLISNLWNFARVVMLEL